MGSGLAAGCDQLVCAMSRRLCMAAPPLPQPLLVFTMLLCRCLLQAYKVLALKKHPDKNKGNPNAGTSKAA